MDKSIEQGESLPARIVDSSYEWLARRGRGIVNKHVRIPSELDDLLLYPTFLGGLTGVMALLPGTPTSTGLIAGALMVPAIARIITHAVGKLEEHTFNKAVSEGRMVSDGKWKPKPKGK